jgi:hypothetical protein
LRSDRALRVLPNWQAKGLGNAFYDLIMQDH